MMKLSFEETLISVWQQTLVDNAKTVELVGKSYGVLRTAKRRLRQVDFVYDGQSLQTDPGRFNTLLHAGEMAEELGSREEAAGYYRLLLRNAAQPSPKYEQILTKARTFLGSAGTSSDHH